MHADRHQISCKLISTLLASKFSEKVTLSLLMGMIKYSQSTQSDKCAIYLQYLEKKVVDTKLMDAFFACIQTPKFLRVGVFMFDGSG